MNKKTIAKVIVAIVGQIILSIYDVDAMGTQQKETVAITTDFISISQEAYEELISYKVLYNQYKAQEEKKVDQEVLDLLHAQEENANLKKSLEQLNQASSQKLNAILPKPKALAISIGTGMIYGKDSGFGGYLGTSYIIKEHWGFDINIAITQNNLFEYSLGLRYQI